MSNLELVPFARPSIGQEEIDEVVDTLKNGWLTFGEKSIKFEQNFADYTGAKNAMAVNSATSALHLCLAAMEIGPGDEVITSPMTFVSTVNVIIHQGAKPVFVDIDYNTLNMDVLKLEKAITSKTKAIIPVHMAGLPCNMDEILDIARKHKIKVIEDAAHAIGAEYKNRKIGKISDATCFSFYCTKNITTGEGGMVTTDDSDIAEKIRILRFHGISSDAWKRYIKPGNNTWEAVYPGFKFNISDIQSSIGIHQLKRIDYFMKTRKAIVDFYNYNFENILELRPDFNDRVHAHHLYIIKVKDRQKFISGLLEDKIGFGIHFRSVHMHKYYRERFGFRKNDFPEAAKASDEVISLPLYPDMKTEYMERVVKSVCRISGKKNKIGKAA